MTTAVLTDVRYSDITVECPCRQNRLYSSVAADLQGFESLDRGWLKMLKKLIDEEALIRRGRWRNRALPVSKIRGVALRCYATEYSFRRY